MTKVLAQVAKFGLVGVVATVLDFLILFVLADFIGLHYLAAKVAATVFVMAWNFISRKIWLEDKNAG